MLSSIALRARLWEDKEEVIGVEKRMKEKKTEVDEKRNVEMKRIKEGRDKKDKKRIKEGM